MVSKLYGHPVVILILSPGSLNDYLGPGHYLVSGRLSRVGCFPTYPNHLQWSLFLTSIFLYDWVIEQFKRANNETIVVLVFFLWFLSQHIMQTFDLIDNYFNTWKRLPMEARTGLSAISRLATTEVDATTSSTESKKEEWGAATRTVASESYKILFRIFTFHSSVTRT